MKPDSGDRFERALLAGGMGAQQARVKTEIFRRVALGLEKFNSGLDQASVAFFVPGRVEFLGKHTDYAGGRSLLCTVDRGFCIVATPRNDQKVRVTCPAGDAEFDLSPGLTPRMGDWTNYPMTVARRVARNFPGNNRGADISFESDLPLSSGMSSSSALVVAFFLVLNGINHFDQRAEYRASIRTRENLSEYLGTIENGRSFAKLAGDRGVGTFGGSEDHTAILCAKAKHLVQYSFCPVRLERDIPLPGDHVLVIGVSGVIAEKTAKARESYNAASLLVTSIMERWGAIKGPTEKNLAEVVAEGKQSRDLLRGEGATPAMIDRVDQFIAESTEIIPAAGDALIDGRLNDLGRLVDHSQDLSERLLKNQVPETIFLAKSARECGAIAASAFGAGFGGSVWAMVRRDAATTFIENWREKYAAKFSERATRAQFFQTEAGSGAMSLVP